MTQPDRSASAVNVVAARFLCKAPCYSGLALLATVVPGLLLFAGAISAPVMNAVTLAGTITWFVATPLWMGIEAATPESSASNKQASPEQTEQFELTERAEST